VVLRHTPIFNVNRHVLFVVPFLAVIAGVSAAVFLDRPGWLGARVLAAAGLGLLLLLTAVDMVQLHPYQYVYYNRLFAGASPAWSAGTRPITGAARTGRGSSG